VTDTLNLPVLPLDDVVVLPGMVVPVRLADSEARAAIDAAQAAGQDQVLLVPRLDGKYAKAGTLGEIEQIGRLPGGAQAAVIRGAQRVRIGAGTTGPGAALWVGATVMHARPSWPASTRPSRPRCSSVAVRGRSSTP